MKNRSLLQGCARNAGMVTGLPCGPQQKRAPETDIGRDGVGDVAADDEKSAMREIDDVAQVENERKAERHQHVEGADDEPIGDVKQEQLRHRLPDERSTRLIREAWPP